MSAVSGQSYMMRAIALAARGRALARPNPCVGAVLVRDDVIVGEGYHMGYGLAHAEVNALEAAGDAAVGATCYVTLEPCSHWGKTPPCANALIKARVAKVVVACLDPNPRVNGQGVALLREHGIEVELGLCEKEASALNPAFMHRMRSGKPYYALKSAMSMDGRTAMASGQSQWITGSHARERVHALRAEVDAIVTGIDSVLQDDPQLTVRDDAVATHLLFRQPKRFVLDSNLRIPLTANIFKAPGQTTVITCADNPQKIKALQDLGVKVVVQNRSGHIDLDLVEQCLLEEECHHVLIEAGATLVGSYIAASKVNDWHVFTAPKLMGHTARPLCNWEIEDLNNAKDFILVHVERVGEDLYCRYQMKMM